MSSPRTASRTNNNQVTGSSSKSTKPQVNIKRVTRVTDNASQSVSNSTQRTAVNTALPLNSITKLNNNDNHSNNSNPNGLAGNNNISNPHTNTNNSSNSRFKAADFNFNVISNELVLTPADGDKDWRDLALKYKDPNGETLSSRALSLLALADERHFLKYKKHHHHHHEHKEHKDIHNKADIKQHDNSIETAADLEHDKRVAASLPFLQDVIDLASVEEHGDGTLCNVLYFILSVCRKRCLDVRVGHNISDAILYYFCLNFRGGDACVMELKRFLTKMAEILKENGRLNAKLGSILFTFLAATARNNRFCYQCDFNCFPRSHPANHAGNNHHQHNSHQQQHKQHIHHLFLTLVHKPLFAADGLKKFKRTSQDKLNKTTDNNTDNNNNNNNTDADNNTDNNKGNTEIKSEGEEAKEIDTNTENKAETKENNQKPSDDNNNDDNDDYDDDDDDDDDENDSSKSALSHQICYPIPPKLTRLWKFASYRRRRRHNICRLILQYNAAVKQLAEIHSQTVQRTVIAKLPIDSASRMNKNLEFEERELSFTLIEFLYSILPHLITVESKSRDLPIHLAVQNVASENLFKIIQFLVEKDPKAVSMLNTLSQFPFTCGCLGLINLKKGNEAGYNSSSSKKQPYDLQILQYLYTKYSAVSSSQSPHPIFWACYVNENLSTPAMQYLLELWPKTILQKFNSKWKISEPPFKQFIAAGHDAEVDTMDDNPLSHRGNKPKSITTANTMFTPAELLISKRAKDLNDEIFTVFVKAVVYAATSQADGNTTAFQLSLNTHISYARNLINNICTAGCPASTLSIVIHYWPDVLKIEDPRGWLPIHTLCSKRHLSVDALRLLVDTYPDSVMTPTNDQNGHLPLYLLLQRNLKDTDFKASVAIELLEVLFKYVPDMLSVENLNKIALKPLQWLIRHGACIELIDYFLNKAPHTIEASEFQNTFPIHVLFMRGCWTTYLSPNIAGIVDFSTLTPDLQVIERIVQASKCTPSKRNLLLEFDRGGQLPLHASLRQYAPHPAVIELLLQAEPLAASKPDLTGDLPLHMALSSKNWAQDTIFKLYLQHPQALKELNSQQKGCIFLAIEALTKKIVKSGEEYCQVLQLLISKDKEQLNLGAKLDIKQIIQPPEKFVIFYPWGQAVMAPHYAALKLIVQYWPDILDHKIVMKGGIFDGFTLLHFACDKNAGSTVIRYLIEQRPQYVRQTDAKGRYPLEILLRYADVQLNPDSGIASRVDFFRTKLQYLLNAWPEAILLPGISSLFASEDYYEDASVLTDWVEILLTAVGLSRKPGVRHALHCIPCEIWSKVDSIANTEELTNLQANNKYKYDKVLDWLIAYIQNTNHKPIRISQPVNTNHGPNNHNNNNNNNKAGHQSNQHQSSSVVKGEKALHRAEDFLILALSLAAPAKMIKQKNFHGVFSISIAAKLGSLRGCQLLEKSGAELLTKDKHGKFPIDYCNSSTHPECYRFLKEKTSLLRMYRGRYELSGTIIYGGKHFVEFAKDTHHDDTTKGKESNTSNNNNNTNNKINHPKSHVEHNEVALKFFSGESEFKTELAIHQLALNQDKKGSYIIPLVEYFSDAKRMVSSSDIGGGEREWKYCIVMEKGVYDLQQALEAKYKSNTLKLEDIRAIGLEIGRCLAYLHGIHILHGDLKLGNVVLGKMYQSYKLIDFDCARQYGASISASITPAYCSPEKARVLVSNDAKYANGEGPVIEDGSYDIWCFGIILLELFAGRGLYSPQLVKDEIIRECASFTEESLSERLATLLPELDGNDFRHNFCSVIKLILTTRLPRTNMHTLLQHPFFTGGSTATSTNAKLTTVSTQLGTMQKTISHIDSTVEAIHEDTQQLKQKIQATMNAIISINVTTIPRYFLMLPALANSAEFISSFGKNNNIKNKATSFFTKLRNKLDVNERFKLYFLCAAPMHLDSTEDSEDTSEYEPEAPCPCSENYLSPYDISVPGKFICQAAPILSAVNTLMKIASIAGKFAGIPIPYGIPILGDIVKAVQSGVQTVENSPVFGALENYTQQALDLAGTVIDSDPADTTDDEEVDLVKETGSNGKKPNEAYGAVYDNLKNLLNDRGVAFGHGTRVAGLNLVLTKTGQAHFVCDNHLKSNQFTADKQKRKSTTTIKVKSAQIVPTTQSNMGTNNGRIMNNTQPQPVNYSNTSNNNDGNINDNNNNISTDNNPNTPHNNIPSPSPPQQQQLNVIERELFSLRKQFDESNKQNIAQQKQMLELMKQLQQTGQNTTNPKSAVCTIL